MVAPPLSIDVHPSLTPIRQASLQAIDVPLHRSGADVRSSPALSQC